MPICGVGALQGSSHAVLPGERSVKWESPVAQRYADASDRRAVAMDRLLWSHAEGQTTPTLQVDLHMMHHSTRMAAHH